MRALILAALLLAAAAGCAKPCACPAKPIASTIPADGTFRITPGLGNVVTLPNPIEYRCVFCSRRFLVGGFVARSRCAVYHPGTCCHEGETEIAQ